MTVVIPAADAAPNSDATFRGAIVDTLRLIVTAGVSCGVVFVGVGARLAMLLLRVTSEPFVHGVESDHGFRIGRVTVGGTYNLLALGAAVGVIGASTYLLVRTWLIGPRWLRRTTVGVASAVVAGSMLVHDDGIDFHLLAPNWLAIGLFVLLPGTFGVAIAATVDRLNRHVGVRRARIWWPPLLMLAVFPQVLILLPFVAVVVVVFTGANRSDLWRRLRARRSIRLGVRAGWASIAVLGVIALVNDVVAIV
jgi:hypothetical protein